MKSSQTKCYLLTFETEHTLDNETDPTVIQTEPKKLTTAQIAKAMELVEQAIEIFCNNDPDENRSAKASQSLSDAIQCYKNVYMEKKAIFVQQTLDAFLCKNVTQPEEIMDD